MNTPFVEPVRHILLRSCLALSLIAASVPTRAEEAPRNTAAIGAPQPRQAEAPDGEKAKRSMAQGKQLALACKLYAADNDGAFPPDLETLVPIYVQAEGLKKLLASPFALGEANGYTYHAGLNDTSDPKAILLEDKFAPQVGGLKIAIHVDGSAEATK